jgi:hypothetical protein
MPFETLAAPYSQDNNAVTTTLNETYCQPKGGYSYPPPCKEGDKEIARKSKNLLSNEWKA